MDSTTRPVAASGAAAPAGEGAPLAVLVLAMVVTIGPLIALSQVVAHWRTDVVDDQMFGYYGWRIAHGAVVYRDIWDNKPPGIYWINALGMLLGRDSYLGVIALCAVALVVAHAAFFAAASAVYHRSAAALTTILLGFYLTHAYYTGGTNRTETFLVAAELTGVALYLRGFRRDRAWRWYLAGLCCGLAFLFKQVGLAALGCMGLHLIVLAATRDLPLRQGLRRGLLLAGGAATTVGVAALALAAQGVLGEALFATFGFNAAYITHGDTQFPYNFANRKLLERHVGSLLTAPLLMAAAAVIHAGLWQLRPRHRPAALAAELRPAGPTCPRPVLFFTLWLAVATYGAMLSPHAFRHYLVPTIPPLLLLAGYLVHVLRGETRLLTRMVRWPSVTVALVVLVYFAGDALQSQLEEVAKVWVDRIERREPAEWEVVGDAIAAVTEPGDRIQCWGYLPGAYLRSRRINATRFTTTEKVGQVEDGARFVVAEMEARLRAEPPEALVLPHSDYVWMLGRGPAGRPSDFTIGPWIEQNYRIVSEVPKFGTYYVLKRKDLCGPEPDGHARRP